MAWRGARSSRTGAVAGTSGMIFLDSHNKIVEATLISKAGSAKREPIDLRISDFGDTLWRMYVDPSELSIFTVSIKMGCGADLLMYGGEVMLEEQYAGMVTAPADGFDVTLQFSLDDLPEPIETLAKKIALLRRNLMGAPFDQCFTALSGGSSASLPPISIAYRSMETLYIIPQRDRIVIVFSVFFADETDSALAAVFLQGLQDVSKRVSGSPPVSFSREPPMELRDMDIRDSPGIVGFVSLAIFTSHCDGAKREKAVTMVSGLRNYLHYHIKASKTYLHSRMRRTVLQLLQVLNRAIPAVKKEDKKMKLMSGRTFVRK